MSSIEYEEKILTAIGTIVDNAIDNADYDKTIKAVIEKCIDNTTGLYSIKYQDSLLQAYAADTSVVYPKGTLVQVLVPGNDLTQNKTILGAVIKGQAEYGTLINPESQYEIIGPNVINADSAFGVCSYINNDIEMLYNRDAGINLINLDTVTFANNIKKTDTIICAAEFKTELASEQAARGNFGIAFDIDFKDNVTGDIVTRTFIIDTNQMLGNPYSQKEFTRQSCIFEVNGENYDSINQIYLFAKDFMNTAVDKPDDIFAQNFELSCADRLTEEELNSCSLAVVTSGKDHFTDMDADDDTIILLANFRIRGSAATSATPGIEYYWFKENTSITKRSLNYCNYGGEGWECLNPYNSVDTGIESKAWVSGSASIRVQKRDIAAGTARYKCVVIYNVINQFEDSIELYNYDSLYNLDIVSDQGTTFYYDNGNPTLTLTVNGSSVIDPEMTYQWAVIDRNGQYTKLPDTTTLNTNYNTTKTQYDNLVAQIASGTLMPVANRATLEALKDELDSYELITRVEDNVIYKVQIKDITIQSTYKCTVYRGDIYIGTAAITLTNDLNIEGMYNLEIVNGDQVFNYNSMGGSPANTALEDPIVVQPLSFKIYDNLGNELGDIIYRHCDIEWTIPKENTMLIGNDATNTLTYNFDIADTYDNFKTNNNIELTVKYKELNIKGQTTLSFLKDGDPGTNGTDMICKIVPNTTSTMNTYPMLINGVPNFPVVTTGKWFKVQLWKNGKKIFDNTGTGNSTEGLAATVKWSILKNQYTSSVSDPSAINVDNNGNFSYNTINENGANIVKCSVEYDGKYYYSMLPLITQNVIESGYQIELEKNTGYRYVMYSSAGKEPQYDNTYPFTLKVSRLIDGYLEDISDTPNSTYKLTYSWAPKGRIYNSTGWVNTGNLTAISGETTNINKRSFKPSDTFDGECVTNAIYVTISNNGSVVAYVHIPVHFYLNKYGIAALNDWDGNSIDLNNKLGSILAPQVGAGSKDSNNRFTGVLMGKVKESNLTEKEGLFGYHQGDQTIFLDAHTGKAEFGKQGASQIILDPTNNTAKIQSGNYVAGTSGLLIDFTTPEIKFGSGNFSVNSSGYLTAKGGGSIAGWSIANNRLSSGSGANYVALDSGTSGVDYGIWLGDGTPANAPFSVSRAGAIKATSGHVGGMKIDSYGIWCDNGNDSAGIGMINHRYAFWAGAAENDSGSAKFRVGHNGELKATAATIEGTITTSDLTATGGSIKNLSADNITATNFTMNSGSLTIGSSFKVTSNGKLTCSSGQIGKWYIKNNGLYYNDGSNTYLGGDGTIRWSNDNTHFLTMNSGTNHPYASALNVGYDHGGVCFMSKGSVSDAGSVMAKIFTAVSGGTTVLYMNCDSGGANICGVKCFEGYVHTSWGSGKGLAMGEKYINQEGGSGGQIRVNGSIVLQPNTAGSFDAFVWNTNDSSTIVTKGSLSSSKNVKTNIQNLSKEEYVNLYKDLQQLPMYTYDYKYKKVNGNLTSDFGFIIDDIEETKYLSKYFHNFKVEKCINEKNELIFPSEQNKDKNYENITVKTWDNLSYIKGLFMLVKSLQVKIDELEDKIKEKEGQ